MSRQSGLHIAGYYHGNELFRDTSVDIFSQRIADKVSEHAENCSVLVTLDNRRMGLVLEQHALIVQRSGGGGSGDQGGSGGGSGKWRSTDKAAIRYFIFYNTGRSISPCPLLGEDIYLGR